MINSNVETITLQTQAQKHVTFEVLKYEYMTSFMGIDIKLALYMMIQKERTKQILAETTDLTDPSMESDALQTLAYKHKISDTNIITRDIRETDI